MAEIIVTHRFGLNTLDLPGDFFNDFAKIVNQQIEYGLNLDPDRFQGDGLDSVKKYYKELPNIEIKTQSYEIKERIHRCAAQLSYFAVSGYRRQQDIAMKILPILQKHGWVGSKERILDNIQQQTLLSYFEIDNKLSFLRNIIFPDLREHFEEITFDQKHSFFSDTKEKK